MQRIGVFVCHCGSNIAATVDVKKVVELAAKEPGVVHAEDYQYMCSEAGQAKIQEAIKEKKLTGVVVCSCSPRMHEATFRKAAERAGLNPYMVEIANIRERSLHFEKVTREQAERVFRLKESDITQEDIRCFQDYLFWKICEIAAEVSLPLQCHTGMGQVIDTNILQLNNVIKNNPETKFVLLHCGFPWVDDLFSIVDGYPNLYPDLTWLPILSYTASKRVMHQLIEMSQIDKICWGCDTWTVEESYGSLLAFRFSLCSVLREKIEDGYLSVNNAKDIIDKILFDNAGKIYV